MFMKTRLIVTIIALVIVLYVLNSRQLFVKRHEETRVTLNKRPSGMSKNQISSPRESMQHEDKFTATQYRITTRSTIASKQQRAATEFPPTQDKSNSPSLMKPKQQVTTTELELNSFKIENINCAKVLQGDESEINEARKQIYNIPNDQTLIDHTHKCDLYKQVYGYNNILNTEEEKQFPIAFNILLYKDVAQVEILLRAIYRPQNYYCLHVDGFSPDHVHKAAKALVDCFDNVFIVSKIENIVYESFQRLQADLNCMADHLVKPDWKYLINLPSQELPIKTNLQIVRILKLLNNTNQVGCRRGIGLIMRRFVHRYEYIYEKNGTYKIVNTHIKYKLPPHRFVVAKGSAYGLFTHQFVKYVITSQIAKDVLDWCRGILSPDEYYWSMLNFNHHVQVPGSGQEACLHVTALSTYASWSISKTPDKCRGKWMRNICVFSGGDLKMLLNRTELFANKFELEYSYAAIQCLSEWLHNQTLSPQPIDAQFYKRLYQKKITYELDLWTNLKPMKYNETIL
ncbi:beta-1,3-galactosyl-O-glycosyl-glycoprotein beta-1,6-N-acetylglucosaminyltransferase [Patella vulgata]|uniref:beta-1,3-galactosyl-O-glycosyl-glycoprotein beta-1,6-N-acetylglucosaminyltransferase n=1 Tax=Patella vulgata TaxID=6465 RepID=UPI00218057EC|nr:beta-1,3-galactosyl-O-glycosyl-glycoprotein beta-1,6-N-acetylglucosaminyltransferase [Patella vulgata]XP_050394471.1 beta-1,3-galactosyl-O-glycosyl-glycoprotein beta-1,6-N-acetylglucosaminyltransferase [Patella vulgata]